MKLAKTALVKVKRFQGCLKKRARLCKNSEAHPYVGVEREQRHSILELDDQFFDFSHRLERLARHFRGVRRQARMLPEPSCFAVSQNYVPYRHLG